MELLRLSIHQTYAQIGLQTQQASQDLHAPMGELSIQQHPAEMIIHSPQGNLEVDSTAAWEALCLGSNLQFMNHIYSQIPSVFLQGLAKMVEDGNRMAEIKNPRNAFADIAAERFSTTTMIDYAGDPSYMNVKVNYTPKAPEIDIQPRKADIEYTPRKVEAQYNPGRVDIYLRQRNTIEIEVSRYDWYK